MRARNSVPFEARPPTDKAAGRPTSAGRGLARAFRLLYAAFTPRWRLHRDQRALRALGERALEDIGVNRRQLRRPIGEAHWFYDEGR